MSEAVDWGVSWGANRKVWHALDPRRGARLRVSFCGVTMRGSEELPVGTVPFGGRVCRTCSARIPQFYKGVSDDA
jgi:hypothetical protein